MDDAAPNAVPDRRKTDPRLLRVINDVAQLREQHAELLAQVVVNTALTQQVKEILEGFRLTGRIARGCTKWIAILTGVVIAVQQFYSAARDFWHFLWGGGK